MSPLSPAGRHAIDPDAPTVSPAHERVASWAHREVRHLFSAEVTLTEPSLAVPVTGVIRGLSSQGAYLETRRTLRVDTPVSLELPIDGGALAVTGRVIWIRRAGRSKLPPGLGIRFDPVGEAERLAEALEQLPMMREASPHKEADLDYRFTEPLGQ